jgi:uncharacterized protein (TIGR04255 family)
MNTSTNDLPEFDAPPLDEVALSVQFQTIPGLQVPQIGLLWARYRDKFPTTEQHPPLDPVLEQYGPPVNPSVRLEISATPPIPRCWFLNGDSTELIQVQQDRFIHNWRKANTSEQYPRYEHVRREFEKELETFCDFIRSENLGEFLPNQCEVTYTNVVSTEQNVRHGNAGFVITPFSLNYSDNFLGEPENLRFATQYIFKDDAGDPMGRLHISLKPAFRVSDGAPIFILNMTARGAPKGKAASDILNFFDIGRQWIVRGFASITTPDMHTYWRRKDATKSGNN